MHYISCPQLVLLAQLAVINLNVQVLSRRLAWVAWVVKLLGYVAVQTCCCCCRVVTARLAANAGAPHPSGKIKCLGAAVKGSAFELHVVRLLCLPSAHDTKARAGRHTAASVQFSMVFGRDTLACTGFTAFHTNNSFLQQQIRCGQSQSVLQHSYHYCCLGGSNTNT